MKTCHRSMTAGGFEVLEQEYTPRHRLARHDHEAAEFCLVLSGTLTETIDRGAALMCRPREASFKPAGAHHRVSAGPKGARCLVITVPAGRGDCEGRTGGSLSQPGWFSPGVLAGFGARLLGELHTSDEFAPLAAEGIALELIAAAARQSTGSDNAAAHPWVRAVRDRVHDEIALGRSGSASLSDLASAAGVSATSLAQAFKRAYGVSIGTYARRLKLDRAKSLLLEARPLSDIALECGFYDQSHFTRVFRKENGITPSRYRREHVSG